LKVSDFTLTLSPLPEGEGIFSPAE
jgi:hypothetical protein